MGEPLVPAGEGVWVPDWLGPADHVWLEALLDEATRSAGAIRREFDHRVRAPLRVSAPLARWRAALAWLDQHLELAVVQGEPSPAVLRASLYARAQRARTEGRYVRADVVRGTGDEWSLTDEQVDARLFGDLPSERPVKLPLLPSAAEVALRVNHAIARRVLRSAAQVDLHVLGNTRAVLRQIRWRRLLFTATPASGGAHVRISGPVSLFRQTTRYGRALASVVSSLRGADRFTLLAHRPGGAVRIASGDPVFPAGDAPAKFDSRLEERFYREFQVAAPDWDLVREPEPIAVGGGFVFPDFAIVHRRDLTRRWLLEIVGFWTPEYLDAKVARLAKAGRRDLVVCVDQRGDCGSRAWEHAGIVVPFTRRIDPLAVLAIVEAGPRTAAAGGLGRERTTVADLFVDWAGRHDPGDALHARLEAAQVGDMVSFAERGDWTLIVDGDGRALGALSATGKRRWHPRRSEIASMTIAVKVRRRAEQSNEPWRARLKCAAWWLVMVEVCLG